jgi:hypothetical protein
LHVFIGKDRAEAEQMTVPSHVVKGLESSPNSNAIFAKAGLCKRRPRNVGAELGTGEMQVLNTRGRAIQEVRRACD